MTTRQRWLAIIAAIALLTTLVPVAAAAPTKVVRTSNGNWTVPAGVTSITVKAWGGGGGGGAGGDELVGGHGGGGGFAQATLSVSAGEVLTVRVGGGGAGGVVDGSDSSRVGRGGGGGGYSGILRGSTPLIIAAGGGGGGGGDNVSSSTGAGNGGAGGGTTGVSGGSSGSGGGSVAGGTGGTNSSGGTGGGSAGNGGELTGGAGASAGSGTTTAGGTNGGGVGGATNVSSQRPGGGGGGAGYFGGGGGGAAPGNGRSGAGGGGGASYTTGSATSTSGGSGRNPGATSDDDYDDEAGTGGNRGGNSGGSSGRAGQGGHRGLVVIIYQVVPNYTITVALNDSAGGTTTPAAGTHSYPEDTEITFVAAENVGWRWDHWTIDGDEYTSRSVPWVVDGNVTATAYFVQTHQLTTGAAPSSGGWVSPASQPYDHGTSVEVTANANYGWEFVNWSGDNETDDNPITVVMNGNRSVIAQFQRLNYTLTTDVSGSGSITRNPDAAQYPYQTSVSLTPVPAAGWQFVRWEGALTGSTVPGSVEMTENKAVTAVFEQIQYSLDVTKVGTGTGSVTVNPEKAYYVWDDVVTLTATANPGSTFMGWGGDLVSLTSPETITIRSNMAITANFDEDHYELTVIETGPGSVAINPDNDYYLYGDVVTLTAEPDFECAFVGWGGALSGTTLVKTLTMNGNKTVEAFFRPMDKWSLVVSTVGGGTVSKNPNLPYYLEDTTVTLTAQPGHGWKFEKWTGDVTGTSTETGLTMNGDKFVTAHFVKVPLATLSVTVVKTDGGDVSGIPVAVSGALNGTVHTNASGTATLNGLWDGTYTVDASSSGYASNGPRTVVIDSHTGSGSATITLTPSIVEPPQEPQTPPEQPQQPVQPELPPQEPIQEPTQPPAGEPEVPSGGETPTTPVLPATGTEYTGLIMLGTLIMVAGVAMRSGRRQRKN